MVSAPAVEVLDGYTVSDSCAIVTSIQYICTYSYISGWSIQFGLAVVGAKTLSPGLMKYALSIIRMSPG